MNLLRIATRQSPLALWQAEHVALALWALVSASEQTARAPAAARKTSSGNTARTAVHQPTGVAGAAA